MHPMLFSSLSLNLGAPVGQDNPFLQTILDDPADDAPRLIYADWLEERGERNQAEFLRLECQLARWTLTDDQRATLLGMLQRSRGLLEDEWIRRLGIRTILAERTPVPFWSPQETVDVTARYALQAGGRAAFAQMTFRFSPLNGKTAIVLEDKVPWMFSREYGSGVVAGVREGIQLHSLSGRVLGSLRMQWIDALEHTVDSTPHSFQRAAARALTHPEFTGKLVQVAQC
jgi:uncharacterized protein (TIGR02996 family)